MQITLDKDLLRLLKERTKLVSEPCKGDRLKEVDFLIAGRVEAKFLYLSKEGK